MVEVETKDLSKPTLYLILYFIEKLDGVLGRTHLQKLLFLTDLMSTKKIKETITELEYQKYAYGPYCEEVSSYIEALSQKDLIEEKVFPFYNDMSKKYARYYLKKKISVREKIKEFFGLEKMMIIDEVIQSYGNISLQTLLDIVYDLQIVKVAELCKPLKMAEKDSEDNSEPKDETDLPF